MKWLRVTGVKMVIQVVTVADGGQRRGGGGSRGRRFNNVLWGAGCVPSPLLVSTMVK